MNYRFLSCALWCLFFLSTNVTSSAQAASSGAKAVKLEHMDYFHARKIILGYGWRLIGGPCSQVSKETCDRFPEIEVCSGVWPAPCVMIFVKQDRCLIVGTFGGEPVGDEEGDTHVDSVEFRRGPCPKN